MQNNCYDCKYYFVNEEQIICKKYKVSLGKTGDILVKYCALFEIKNFKGIDYFSEKD